jgi:hypothetical protein
MHNVKAQTELVDATANMLRAFALVAARAASLSASRSLSLWALMLAASTRSPWSWAAWNEACVGSGAPQGKETPGEVQPEASTADPPYASYRSAGGHAVAQVIVG